MTGTSGAADMADVPIQATSTVTHPSAFFPGRTAALTFAIYINFILLC